MKIARRVILQWLLLLLATLPVSATGVLFVKPTNDTPCPQQPCHTLEYYAQSWQLYLTSNTIVQFLPGEHILEGDWNELGVENVSNLTLIGSNGVILDSSPLGTPVATSRVSCRRGETVLLFYNVTELFIARLTISECGGVFGKTIATLFLHEVSNLILENVTINNSTGTGMVGLNLGKSLIYHSAFMFSRATKAFHRSSNIILLYGKCSELLTYTLNISSSWILFGNATHTTNTTSVGGLILQVDQSCYNVNVHIHNTTLKENMGGNMLISLNGIAGNIIIIADSHFEGGYTSYRGGGIVIFTNYNSSQLSQYAVNNLVYINNTEFVRNYAGSGGAVFVFACTGTELYINGSKFHNNVAHDGGHIAIALVSSSTCTNVTITINSSVFEGGQAIGGIGGGVVVRGPPNNSQCTNGNHVYISNTLFVGNHAKSGGAVSLLGCVGDELHIDESEFNNNTAQSGGGHIALELTADQILLITVNNSHFESGKALVGGGILLFASDRCTPVSSTIHKSKSVYITNSKVYQNVAKRGGGMAILFQQRCYAIDLLIHNVSLSKNTATNFTGGNIYLLKNVCTTRNLITISESTVEFGSASATGGGMAFVTIGSITCIYSEVSLKPTTINIVDSLFQYNTARALGGGLVIFFGLNSCCSAEVNITNVTFLNNKAGTVPVSVVGSEILTKGGNIYIENIIGHNSSVRIHDCMIKGGVARAGGGIFVFACTGTELYINGSKFHNNVAHDGGHIAIALVSSSTCTNIITTINSSLFEGGQATGGIGGGVVVRGPPNNSQCTNGNHVYISNTLFVGNHAKSGGAVSLLGCVGDELHIDESEFNNNTAQSGGGHIALELTADQILLITVNNSHFESGKALVGGGISLFASDRCTSVNGSIHKSVYITNSKIYQNVAELGGGMGMIFSDSCFAIDVVIDNVSLSRNAATNNTEGNIFLSNDCAAENSVTISRSTVEFGNASDNGGGMIFTTYASEACSSSIASHKPAIINIVDSTFQYNTAYALGGGLAIYFGLNQSSVYSCCSAEVNITNVTFLNNKVGTVPVSVDGIEILTKGGNIYIQDSIGQWLNNSVRIHDCLLKGGVAGAGGGISLYQIVNYGISWQISTEMEGLFISNTHFICNRATADSAAGASLRVEGKLLKSFSMTLNSLTPIILKKLTIMNTTFDGSCEAGFNNVIIFGLGLFAPYIPTGYSVVFANVSFRGYSMNQSSQLSDLSADDFLLYLPNSTTLNKIQPGVVLFFVPNATFIDCEFFESTADSALYARSTNMFFGGNIIFQDNVATSGAGLQLRDSSVMYLRPNTHILFSHNHAMYAGGAIHVQSVDTSGNVMCFYQFDGVSQVTPDLNIQIKFENNTAYFAGSALYGGLVDYCSLNVGRNNSFDSRINFFDSIFQVQNTDENPSAISSDPYKVCLCTASKPLCSNKTHLSIRTYPGALFQIQAVVVGQKDGTAPGVVRATLQNTSAVLGDLQQSQATGKSCTTLNYTVYSTQTEETIILVTETFLRKLRIVTQPGLIINVALLNCPWGFTLAGSPTKCDCADELQKHRITCNITTQTITRPPPLWIGYYHSGSDTEPPVEGVLVHDNCPFDYCKPEQLSIQLNDSDKQCAFNHSGILCGACQPGLSLALGTSRCLKCSNKYLMLLFAFAAAGLALVFLLTLTNMTVSEGTINGLIFYANTIHINRAIFFPSESTGINKIVLDILYTFISWINLDLGIETCFYSGMDMYTKAWLQFLFPIYIWTIVGGMIVSSHYSSTAAKLFRRHAVKVLATLFLLSFAKLQRTIITALSFTFLTYPDRTKTVWLYDSNIEYLHGKHVPLFIAAVLALLFFLIPYTLVLLSIQFLFKLDCRIFFWVAKLKPLFDAYTGPYKDRYRFWTGFLLVVRTVLFLIFTLGNPGLNLTAISATSTCLAFTPAVYKKVWLTVLEYSLLLNLSVASAATFYCRDPQYSGNQAVVVYISVGAALITFVMIMVYHLYQCTINSRACKTVSVQRNNNRELVNIAVEGSDEEEEEEPAQAEIRPLMLRFDEYREPILVYEDQN